MSVTINNTVNTVAVTSQEKTVAIISHDNTKVTISEVGTQGVKGDTGEGYTESQVSWGYFKDAGETTKDDNLFPNVITKADYSGVTNAVRNINRNISNNLIMDSVVDTYDFNGSNYVWTTPYLGGTDLLANRPGIPSVVIT